MWGAIFLLVAPPVPAYVAANELGTVDPSPRLNAGEVVVLEQFGDAIGNHQVLLSMDADPLPAGGGPPRVLYTVAVCGSGRFTGLLYLSGSATLRTYDARSPQLQPVTAVAVPAWTFTLGPQPVGGSGQAFPVEISSPPACTSDAASLDAPGSFSGAAFTVSGRLTAPITEHYDWGHGIVGARQWQSWPSVGGFRTVPPGLSGAFTRRTDDTTWIRPALLAVQVTSALPAGQTVASAAPPSAVSSGLSWRSRRTITPTARLVDVDRVVLWQRVSLYLGLWIAVGLSVLATAALDWLRRWGSSETTETTRAQPAQHTTISPPVTAASPSPPSIPEPTATPIINDSAPSARRDFHTLRWAAMVVAIAATWAAIRHARRRSVSERS